MPLTRSDFVKLYASYSASLRRYADWLTKGSEYAEDITQETWQEAWRARAKLDADKGVWPWLKTILRRLWWWHLNPNKKPAPMVEQLPSDYDRPVRPRQTKVASALFVNRAVRQLSPKRQSIIRLYFSEEMTAREIGERQGTTRQAVDQQIVKSLADLRLLLDSPINRIASER